MCITQKMKEIMATDYQERMKQEQEKRMHEIKVWVKLTIVALFILIGGVGSCMFVRPRYNVWKQEMEGKAEFAKAEQNRKIKIEEARANLEAEKLNAQAEVERAKGAAKAIQIENGSLTPEYIQYLWVRQQGSLGDKTVIYIPTEASLPILEAGRVNKKQHE